MASMNTAQEFCESASPHVTLLFEDTYQVLLVELQQDSTGTRVLCWPIASSTSCLRLGGNLRQTAGL